MSRFFGFISILVVVAAGAYIYMRQAQGVAGEGSVNPLARVETTGVKTDLLAIAQAERNHNALHGGYVSIDDLRNAGELTLSRSNRGQYTYSAEVSDTSFRIVATYGGPDPGMPKTISIDQSMQITQ